VPENRKEQGLVLRASCVENIGLAKLPWLKNLFGVINNKAIIEIYETYKDKLSIASPSPQQKVLFLSGGNQQKIVIGKWLSLIPELLILDEPTRGIDVGSKSEIHKLIASLAEQGMAIIVISSEMSEIIGISNRIITIANGLQTAEFSDDKITEENIINAIY
jgi:ribose transport system ATP-binding protein